MSEATETTEATTIAALGLAIAEPQYVDPGDLILVKNPISGDSYVINTDAYGDQPRLVEGDVTLGTREDFKAYVERHDVKETTTLWVSRTGLLIALLDDHVGSASTDVENKAAWGHHRARCMLEPTPEWKFWLGMNDTWLDQVDFAEHVEAGLKEIFDPAAADMLELAQEMEASSSADFARSERLDNGLVGISYKETQTARAGQSGRLDIPKEFTLRISPFIGEEAVDMKARFRYRIRGNSLKLAYLLDRPHEVIDKVIANVHNDLRDSFETEGSVPRVFVGTPRTV